MKIIMMVVFIMTAFKVWAAASPKGANNFYIAQKSFFFLCLVSIFIFLSIPFTYFKNVISILPTYLYRKGGMVGGIGDENKLMRKNDGFDIFLIVDSPTLRDKEERGKKRQKACALYHFIILYIFEKCCCSIYMGKDLTKLWENPHSNKEKVYFCNEQNFCY